MRNVIKSIISNTIQLFKSDNSSKHPSTFNIKDHDSIGHHELPVGISKKSVFKQETVRQQLEREIFELDTHRVNKLRNIVFIQAEVEYDEILIRKLTNLHQEVVIAEINMNARNTVLKGNYPMNDDISNKLIAEVKRTDIQSLSALTPPSSMVNAKPEQNTASIKSFTDVNRVNRVNGSTHSLNSVPSQSERPTN